MHEVSGLILHACGRGTLLWRRESNLARCRRKYWAQRGTRDAPSGNWRTSDAGDMSGGISHWLRATTKLGKGRCQLRPHRLLRGCVAGPVESCHHPGQGSPGDGERRAAVVEGGGQLRTGCWRSVAGHRQAAAAAAAAGASWTVMVTRARRSWSPGRSRPLQTPTARAFRRVRRQPRGVGAEGTTDAGECMAGMRPTAVRSRRRDGSAGGSGVVVRVDGSARVALRREPVAKMPHFGVISRQRGRDQPGPVNREAPEAVIYGVWCLAASHRSSGRSAAVVKGFGAPPLRASRAEGLALERVAADPARRLVSGDRGVPVRKGA